MEPGHQPIGQGTDLKIETDVFGSRPIARLASSWTSACHSDSSNVMGKSNSPPSNWFEVKPTPTLGRACQGRREIEVQRAAVEDEPAERHRADRAERPRCDRAERRDRSADRAAAGERRAAGDRDGRVAERAGDV